MQALFTSITVFYWTVAVFLPNTDSREIFHWQCLLIDFFIKCYSAFNIRLFCYYYDQPAGLIVQLNRCIFSIVAVLKQVNLAYFITLFYRFCLKEYVLFEPFFSSFCYVVQVGDLCANVRHHSFSNYKTLRGQLFEFTSCTTRELKIGFLSSSLSIRLFLHKPTYNFGKLTTMASYKY